MEYLTISELIKETNMAETTIRRYLNTFENFFNIIKTGKSGRYRKYHIDSVGVLKEIYMLFQKGYSTEEISDLLLESTKKATESNLQISVIENKFVAMEAEIKGLREEMRMMVIVQGMQGVKDQMREAEVEMKVLRQEVQDLTKSLENRDVKLVNQMRTILEEKKKPFWKKWFS